MVRVGQGYARVDVEIKIRIEVKHRVGSGFEIVLGLWCMIRSWLQVRDIPGPLAP